MCLQKLFQTACYETVHLYLFCINTTRLTLIWALNIKASLILHKNFISFFAIVCTQSILYRKKETFRFQA
jgi:hypothetical protein